MRAVLTAAASNAAPPTPLHAASGPVVVDACEAILKGALESQVPVGVVAAPVSPRLAAFARMAASDAVQKLLARHQTEILLGGDGARAVSLALAAVRAGRSGLAVVPAADLVAAVDALPHHVRADVRVVLLPMDELGANALMVNAIQRASYVVVQNSLKEGHGLTVMEALYKRQVVVGTRQALGIRSQLVQGETGILVEGDPSDGENVAAALLTALTQDGLRRSLAHNAQRYAVESGLSFTVRRTRKGGAAPLRAPLLPPFALSHKRTH